MRTRPGGGLGLSSECENICYALYRQCMESTGGLVNYCFWEEQLCEGLCGVFIPGKSWPPAYF